MNHPTREAWLTAAVDEYRPYFKQMASVALPAHILVSVGWGIRNPRKILGECWASQHGGGVNHIFLSPRLDGTQALVTLAHELVHAADNCKSNHRGGFIRIAEQIGLEPAPAWSHTGAGPELIEIVEQLTDELGPYPHVMIKLEDRPKKQATRMLKVLCSTCGYTLRTAQSWLDTSGPPLCPGEECEQSPMEVQ